MTQHWRRISRWFTTYRLVGRLSRMDAAPSSPSSSPRSSNGCSNATWPAPRNGSPTSSSRGAGPRLRRPARQWDEHEVDLDPAVRSSLLVNLLTEDNLPYYTTTISTLYGDRRRVGRLGPALDRRRGPALDRAARLPHRHAHARSRSRWSGRAWRRSSAGRFPIRGRIEDGLVYVALQELATRVAHHNTGKVLQRPGRRTK